MTNTAQIRQPKGTPTGGQFAATTQPPAGISLVEMDDAELNEQDRKDLRELNEYLSTLSADDLELAQDLLHSDWDEDELATYRNWKHFSSTDVDEVWAIADRVLPETDDSFFEMVRDRDGDTTGWTIATNLGGKLDAGLTCYTSFSEIKDGPTGFPDAVNLAKQIRSKNEALLALREQLTVVGDLSVEPA